MLYYLIFPNSFLNENADFCYFVSKANQEDQSLCIMNMHLHNEFQMFSKV